MDDQVVFHFSKNICFISAADTIADKECEDEFKHWIPSDYQSIP